MTNTSELHIYGDRLLYFMFAFFSFQLVFSTLQQLSSSERREILFWYDSYLVAPLFHSVCSRLAAVHRGGT